MKKLLSLIAFIVSLTANAQYIPTNPDSTRIGIQVAGIVRSVYVTDLFQQKTILTTVAGLRSMPSSKVHTDMYYILPDGRLFIWNATSTVTDDGGVAIDPTTLSGPGRFEAILDKYVKSEWYLNKADTSDQSTAAQKWLDAAARLKKIAYHSKSVDTVFAKTLLAKTSVEFEEDAWFKLHSSASYLNHDDLFEFTDVKGITNKNMNLDGNSERVFTSAANYCALVRVNTTALFLYNNPDSARNQNIVFDGGYLRNGGGGITIFSTNDVTVKNTKDSNIDGHIIAYGACDNINAYNGRSYGGTSEKVSFWGDDSTHRVTNSSCSNWWFINTEYGFDARYASNFTVDNCFFSGVKKTALFSSPFSVVGTVNSWQQAANHGVVSNSQFINCNTGIVGVFSYTKFQNLIIDSIANGKPTIQIGLNATYPLPGNSFTNITVRNGGAANDLLFLSNCTNAIVAGNTILDDRGAANAATQAIRLDNTCFGVSILNNKISGMKSRNILINNADSTIVEDLNNGQILIGSSATNTLVKMARNVNNSSTSTVMHIISTSAPSGLAGVGSTWINVNGSAGSVFSVNQTGTTTWTPAISASSGGTATSAGSSGDAGYWTKIASITPTADFNDGSAIISINGYGGGAQNAIVGFGYRQNTTGTATIPFVTVLAIGAGAATQLVDTGFMVVNNGYNTAFELWMRKATTFGQFDITELSKHTANAVTYLAAQGWTATRPTGTYTAQSASTSGVTTSGNNTFTGTNTWTNTSTFQNGLAVTGNVTGSSWGLNGIGLKTQSGAVYTDNTSSGTVTDNFIYSFRAPTIAASLKIVGGTGYVAGTYTAVPMTGGTGTGKQATIVVNGSGVVTSVTETTAGSGYLPLDILSASNTNLGGSGSGFTYSLGATYTNVGTLLVEGRPVLGSNVAATNNFAFHVRNGGIISYGTSTALQIGPGDRVTSTYANLNGGGWIGYNATSSNVFLQSIGSRGIEFNVNNGTPTSGTIATISSAGNFRVGDATAGTSTLQVAGSFATAINTTAKTTAYTIVATDGTILCDGTSGAFSATLPTAVGCTGREYIIKKTDASANAITVATTSSQNIIGTSTATTYSLPTQGKFVRVQSDNVGWQVIGSN